MSNTVTFTAARRRFERAHHNHRTISKLSRAEMQGLGGSPFAVLEGNHVVDHGTRLRSNVGAETQSCSVRARLSPPKYRSVERGDWFTRTSPAALRLASGCITN